MQYIRPKQSFYIREALKKLILEVVEADDLDLEVDPSIVRLHQLPLLGVLPITVSQIYRTRASAEEMRTGVHRPEKDLPFYQALNDPDTRAEYIRRASAFLTLALLGANDPTVTQTSNYCNGGARDS